MYLILKDIKLHAYIYNEKKAFLGYNLKSTVLSRSISKSSEEFKSERLYSVALTL